MRLRAVLAGVAAVAAIAGMPGEGGRDDGFGGLDAPLRPGASAEGCTYNFVFRDAEHTYIGTAAHCTTPDEDGVHEPATLAGYGEIGVVVYDSDDAVEASTHADFTLIRLHEWVVPDTNPTVLDWGGPTGIAFDDDLTHGDLVNVHGYGMLYGMTETTQKRQVVLSGWDELEYFANGPIHWGDSGAALLHAPTGKALGIVSRLHLRSSATPPVSSLVGAMLPYILAELEAAGFEGIELVLGDDA